VSLRKLQINEKVYNPMFDPTFTFLILSIRSHRPIFPNIFLDFVFVGQAETPYCPLPALQQSYITTAIFATALEPILNGNSINSIELFIYEQKVRTSDLKNTKLWAFYDVRIVLDDEVGDFWMELRTGKAQILKDIVIPPIASKFSFWANHGLIA
jgi:hypothetical protein